MKNWLLSGLLCMAMALPLAADMFINLGFEELSRPSEPPGWSIFQDQYWVGLDATPISGEGCQISVTTSNARPRDPFIGSNRLFIMSGPFSNELSQTVGVYQVGDVPINAQRLEFITDDVNTSNHVYDFSLGNIDLLTGTQTAWSGSMVRYSTDISALAGMTNVTMTFTIQHLGVNTEWQTLDDIQFIIPEPSSIVLILLGLSGLYAFRRRQPAT